MKSIDIIFIFSIICFNVFIKFLSTLLLVLVLDLVVLDLVIVLDLVLCLVFVLLHLQI